MSRSQDDGVLYFAYGTLLGTAAMADYCPSVRSVGQATLFGYEFCFERYGPGPGDGGCSLVKAEGAETIGVLYQIPTDEWAHLREVSGEHTSYQVLAVAVQRDDRSLVAAQTLTVRNPIGPFRPSEQYLNLVVDGAASSGLPNDYRTKLTELAARARALEASS